MFSAPNYCGTYKNKGAVILLKDQEMKVKQYKSVPEPYRLDDTGELNALTWSLPFLADKICEMMEDILSKAMHNTLQMQKTISDVEFELLMKQIKEGQVLDEKESDSARNHKLQRRMTKTTFINEAIR